ncbi:MAG: hypothetical protein F4019_02240 [Rhodothermaceae bacterium]|nr:hypothetical protein [Rhodothermaceae bacterium]
MKCSTSGLAVTPPPDSTIVTVTASDGADKSRTEYVSKEPSVTLSDEGTSSIPLASLSMTVTLTVRVAPL